jgi:hypothetical protein
MDYKNVTISELEKVFGFEFYDEFTEEEKENTVVTLFEDGSVDNAEGHQIVEPSTYVDFNADEKSSVDEIVQELYEEISLQYSENETNYSNYSSAYEMIYPDKYHYFFFKWFKEEGYDLSSSQKEEIIKRISLLLKEDAE